METNPTESETIIEPEVPAPSNPVEEFKKGKAKRESKRKQVVIQEYVPEPPVTTESVSAAVEVPDAESIASRAAELLFAKISAEKHVVDKTPENKTKTRPKPPAKKKVQSPPTPPPTNYFGWC